MKHSAPGSPKIPLALTALTAVLCMLLLLYIHNNARNTVNRYTPWVDAVTELKLEVALGHLWLEELLSGDSHESISSVRQHLAQAKWYASAILDGGQNEQDRFEALQDPQLRLKANQLLYQIELFSKNVENRYQMAELAMAGSAIDQSFDSIFQTVMGSANNLERQIKHHIKREHQEQNSLMLLLLVTICSMALVAGYSIWRFTLTRARYLKQLSHANQQISEQNQRLKALAHTDQLTGLPNRQMLETLAEKLMSQVQRNQISLSVTFIDIDFFKPINDQYGHHVGDTILTFLSKTITRQLREGDTLARLAGDEFILLVQGSSEEELEKSLDRIFKAVDDRLQLPVIQQPEPIHIRFSAGTAIAPKHGLDFATVLHCADLAMYQSKNNGRGQHCFYNPETVNQSQVELPFLEKDTVNQQTLAAATE